MAYLVGRGSRKAQRLDQSRTAETPSIDEQGLSMRRAVSHDRPRLGALSGLLTVLNEDRRNASLYQQDIREPRPTKCSPTSSWILAPGSSTAYCLLLTAYCLLCPAYAIPFCSTSRLSGVIGRSLTRVPVALNIALAIAAGTPAIPISPIPRTPSELNVVSGMFRNSTSM